MAADWKKVARQRLRRIRELEAQQADFAKRAGELAEREIRVGLKAFEVPQDKPEVKARIDSICKAIQNMAERRFGPKR